MGLERSVTFGADHPALAGHFPGHPVVPGVVMLGEVMNAIREMIKARIEFVGLPAVKFLSPLRPGEPLIISLDQPVDGAAAFTCATASRLIASGRLRYRIVADESTGDA